MTGDDDGANPFNAVGDGARADHALIQGAVLRLGIRMSLVPRAPEVYVGEHEASVWSTQCYPTPIEAPRSRTDRAWRRRRR